MWKRVPKSRSSRRRGPNTLFSRSIKPEIIAVRTPRDDERSGPQRSPCGSWFGVPGVELYVAQLLARRFLNRDHKEVGAVPDDDFGSSRFELPLQVEAARKPFGRLAQRSAEPVAEGLQDGLRRQRSEEVPLVVAP